MTYNLLPCPIFDNICHKAVDSRQSSMAIAEKNRIVSRTDNISLIIFSGACILLDRLRAGFTVKLAIKPAIKNGSSTGNK